MKKVNKNSLHEERGMYRYLSLPDYKKPGPRPTQPTPASKDEGGVSILSIIKFIFMMFIVWTTLTFLNLGFKEITPVNEINGKIFGSNSWLVNKGRSQININPSDSKSQATSANNYENQTVATHSASSSETINNQDPSIKNEVVPEENNIQSNNITQQQEERKCYSCNGTGQCPKCSKPQRVRYKQGESPNDHDEIRFGMIVCTQCGGNLMNFGADKNKSCYLCKSSGW